MKKNKISLFLVSGLVSLAALSACSSSPIAEPSYSKEGNILTYTDSSGNTHNYSAEDLFGSYFDSSSSISTMFDNVYKLIVRNYFKTEAKGIAKYADIKKDASNDVEGVKSTAQKNADSNKTSYDEEWQKLLDSNNAKDEDALLEHFIYQRELKEFERQFYEESGGLFGDKNGIEYLRDAKKVSNDTYEGYLQKKVPYHIRHVLVKLKGTSSSNNYWNDTITDEDASNLYSVAEKLAKGNLSFGEIAQQASEYSDDSAKEYGDLGIMDKDTSFVNEFKLGIYAYENLYSANKDNAANSEISIQSNRSYADIQKQELDIDTEYSSAVTYKRTAEDKKTMTGDDAGLISTIPFGAFEALEKYKTTTASTDSAPVNNGDTAFYPRNVIFNKYLNRHFVSFITPQKILANDDTADWTDATLADNETTVGETDSYDTNVYKGFVTIGNKKVLATKNGDPILVVRAGGDNYQGIHFIVIERSGLEETKANQADLSDYYSVKYTGSDYISDKQTYVNIFNQPTKELKKRAEKVEEKIKGFDSHVNQLIYKSYLAKQKIKFNTFKVGETEYNIGEAIKNWMDTQEVKADYDASVSWESTWETYINSLKQQKAERRKLIPEVCAIGFTHTKSEKEDANGGKDVWGEGGVCYVPQK